MNPLEMGINGRRLRTGMGIAKGEWQQKHFRRPLLCAADVWPTGEASNCAVNCFLQNIILYCV